MPWLRPDAKSQITFRYQDGLPVAVDAIVLSTQHNPDISLNDLRDAALQEIIKPVIPEKWLHKNTLYHINPTGQFIIGGPMGDCGLTRKKNYCRHIWRHGSPWWWCIFWKRSIES